MFHVKHFRRPFVGKNFTVDFGALRNALPQAARQQPSTHQITEPNSTRPLRTVPSASHKCSRGRFCKSASHSGRNEESGIPHSADSVLNDDPSCCRPPSWFPIGV